MKVLICFAAVALGLSLRADPARSFSALGADGKPLVTVTLGEDGAALWSLSGDGAALAIRPPEVEIDGRVRVLRPRALAPVSSTRVFGCVDEHVCEGDLPDLPGGRLRFVFRLANGSPVVRFRYELVATDGAEFRLTKASGRDALRYFGADLSPWPRRTEVRLGDFCPVTHAHRLVERPVRDAEFENALPVMGPILAAEGDGTAVLLAYEHGSQTPNAFVRFELDPASRVAVSAVKGNYWNGRRVTPGKPYETIWFDIAAVRGSVDDLAAAFRDFELRFVSPNAASRRPYVFYNTWALQERDYWWRGSRRFLNMMNASEMEAELDAAHEMGVDVFVVDTGWFEKCGDWRVSRKRFPDGLKPLAERAAGYGMKLGLWFSPTEVAVSSDMMKRNRANVMSFRGKESAPHAVWETEESQNVCLVSDYWRDFADELIRIHRELGVCYFKWDAISQFGCDSPAHDHGDASADAAERADCYAFEQVRYLARVVDRLCAACPDAIVDFDTTEGGRSVGLAFLAAGKYFALNNGPYIPDFDHPYDWNSADVWSNVYVYPGAARARIVRNVLDVDRWIPSVLFLSHYLPDDPESSQLVNLGSMILGQNGVWGEMRRVSPAGRRLFADCLAAYKRVRDDITSAQPIRVGSTSTSLEVHEKLAANGRGAVVVFSNDGGEQTYVTERRAGSVLWKGGDVTVTTDARGRAVLRCRFNGAGARIVLFGD